MSSMSTLFTRPDDAWLIFMSSPVAEIVSIFSSPASVHMCEPVGSLAETISVFRHVSLTERTPDYHFMPIPKPNPRRTNLRQLLRLCRLAYGRI